jgi:hypothetical protein
LNILLVDLHTTKKPLDGKNAMKCHTFFPPSKTPYFYVHWGPPPLIHVSVTIYINHLRVFLLELGIQ